MTTNTTHKNIILLAVIIIGAIMSGCIDSGATASQIVDDITTISIQKSKIAVEVEKPELAAAQNTPEPIQKSYHVSITAQQKSDSLIITVQGGEDFHILKELRVLVNNETMDVYSPDYQVPRKVGCTIIGDWKVICEGTFEDGTTQELLNTRFCGIPNPKVGTTIAPERYVEPSTGTSREEAKRICEENGVVWGCDDPESTPTPIPTPIPVVTPTPTATKNAEPIREDYIYQIGGYKDDMFTIMITYETYHDVEGEAIRTAEHPGIAFRDIYLHRVHPDLKSYNVYINGELRGSYPAPKIEDFYGGCAVLHPRVTLNDYPMTIVVETEYVDGEIFTNTYNAESGRIHTPNGGRRPVECEWCE